ncbi:MAG: DUF2029 domain-containing protein [Chloroflexi bacterium]|nr:MAG: DUF2029 domain-containing protein [Chloroflexota bacterium]
MNATHEDGPLAWTRTPLVASLAYVAGVAAGLALLGALGFASIWQANLFGNDFSAIWAGPHALSLGIDPYDPAHWQETVRSFGVQPSGTVVYTYPGWMPLAIFPLGKLSLVTGAYLFLTVTMIFCGVAVWALVHEFVPPGVVRYFLFGFVLFGSEPGIVGFYSGQYTFFLVGAMSLLAVFLHRRRGGWAGLMASAFLVKPHLFALAAPALVRTALRRGIPRFVWVGLAVTALAAVTSTLAYAHWWGEYLAVGGYQAGNPKSTVLATALADAYGPLGAIVAVVVLIVAVALALRFDPRTDSYVAVWLALSPAAALYEFAYDQLLPLVPLVIATGMISREKPLRARLFAEFGALVIIVGDTFLHGTTGAERGTLSFNAFPQVLIVALVIGFLWPYRKADPAPALQRGS